MRTVTGPWGSFRAWDHDILGNAIAKGEFWDQQIQPFIDEADSTGWALDLGANIGWFTVYMGSASRMSLRRGAPRNLQAPLRNIVDTDSHIKSRPSVGPPMTRQWISGWYQRDGTVGPNTTSRISTRQSTQRQ